MKNVSEIKNCYGCGVCSVACTRRVLDIRLNPDGFYEPVAVRADACNACGLCLDCCAYLHPELPAADTVRAYAAWSNDEAVRRRCSSGGIGYEIGRQLIGRGYQACGVRYNAPLRRAEHYIASTSREYLASAGSKYLPSYTAGAFRSIDRKGRYLVTGTPCQIDSFRRYLRKFKAGDRFVLLDFFCHGVPSMHVWTKYLDRVEKLTGKTSDASWRNKTAPGFARSSAEATAGTEAIPAMRAEREAAAAKKTAVKWEDSYRICTAGEKTFYLAGETRNDAFYTLFLSNICLGKACYARCKYKYTASAADIRIGDLWGKTYRGNEAGVSAVLAFTETGRSLVESLEHCTVKRHTLDEVAGGQLKSPLKEPWLRRRAMALLRRPGSSLEPVVRLAKIQRRIKAWRYRLRRLFPVGAVRSFL